MKKAFPYYIDSDEQYRTQIAQEHAIRYFDFKEIEGIPENMTYCWAWGGCDKKEIAPRCLRTNYHLRAGQFESK